MKFGARNAIRGKVTEIQRGTMMGKAKVHIDAPVDLSSVMTVESLDELELKEGDQVRVVVKAIHVLLVKEG